MELELKNVSKSFESKQVLHEVSMKVKSGRALGLLGRNGAGKTTTIRIIMDVFRADSGEITLDGEKFEPMKRIVGYLPEERGLYPKKVVIDQLIYLGMLRGMTKNDAKENGRKWLDELEVIEYENRKLDTLSKGNQQKVQLAATLVGEPGIVILDEPFSGLDPVNAQVLKNVIKKLINEGRIVIFSSHQMSYVEEFCEDIVIINHGNVVLSGDLDNIKTEYGKGRKIISAENYTLSELKEIISTNMSACANIVGVNKQNVIIELKEGISLWDFLDEIKKDNIEVKNFGSYQPSLNDIFVSKVGEEEETAEEEDKEQEAKKPKKSILGKLLSK